MSSLYDDVYYAILLFSSLVIAVKDGVNRVFLNALVVLLLIMAISLLGANNIKASTFFFVGRDYLVPFSLIFITTSLFKTCRQVDIFIERFYEVWVPIFFVTVIIGLIYPSTNLAHVHTSLDGPDTLRVASFLTNPNTFGYVLCVLYSIAIQKYLITNEKKHLLYICILFFLLILTTSRSTFLLFILITLLAIYLHGNYINFRLFLFAGLLIVFLVQFISWAQSLGYLGDLIISRFQIDRLVVDNNRFTLWNNIISEFECSDCYKEVIFGHGATLISRGYQDDWYEPDNYYLKLYLEIGLVGLLVYIAILFYLLIKSIKYAKFESKFNNDSGPHFIYPATVLIVAFSGSTATILDVYPFNYLVFIIFGLYLSKKSALCKNPSSYR